MVNKKNTPWNLHMDALKRYYRKCDDKEKRIFVLEVIGKILAIFLLATIIIGYMAKWFAKMYSPSTATHGIIYYGITGGGGVAFFGSLIFCFAVAFLIFANEAKHPRELTDKAGRDDATEKVVDNLDDKVMSKEEAKKVYQVDDISRVKTTIIGMFDDYGTEAIGFKPRTNGGTGNQNLIVVGSPGTGKSFGAVRTNILQAMERGDSIIATDPAGELYQTMAKALIKRGYDVKVLNLKEPKFSDCWNFLNEVIDEETGRLSGTRLSDFTDIYIRNSSSNSDPFWVQGSVNLLRALIGFTSYQRESEILLQYRELYLKVSNNSIEAKQFVDQKMIGMCSFKMCEEKIKEAAIANGYSLEEIEEQIQTIKDSAPPFTITEVYNNILNFEDIIDKFDAIDLSHPAKQAFIFYNRSSDTVKQSQLTGLSMALQLYSDEDLRNVLSYDGIDLRQINKKKCAYFVMMQNDSTSLRPITSLFFSFFFKEAKENWDQAEKISMFNGEKNPCLDVYALLDEFFSIGVIGGDPDSFAQTISVNRKYHIMINIFVQDLVQIKTLYNEDNRATILNCCDNLLYIGCNDLETTKYISDFIGGKALFRTESHKESTSVFGPLTDGAEVNVGTRYSALWEPDELRKFSNQVLFVQRGHKPLICKPFGWILHPAAVNGETELTNIYETIKPIGDRVAETKANMKIKSGKDVSDNTKSLKSSYSKNMIKSGNVKVEQTSLEDISDTYEQLNKAMQERKDKRNASKNSKQIGGSSLLD